jgi:hypothetical protein
MDLEDRVSLGGRVFGREDGDLAGQPVAGALKAELCVGRWSAGRLDSLNPVHFGAIDLGAAAAASWLLSVEAV